MDGTVQNGACKIAIDELAARSPCFLHAGAAEAAVGEDAVPQLAVPQIGMAEINAFIVLVNILIHRNEASNDCLPEAKYFPLGSSLLI